MRRSLYKLSDLIVKKINNPGRFGDGNNLYLVVKIKEANMNKLNLILICKV